MIALVDRRREWTVRCRRAAKQTARWRAKSGQYAATTTTIGTDHANELIVVDEVIDARGSAVVAVGLVNRDGSDTFPGRTLTPDQAEELAASLARCATAARARAGLAPAPGEQADAQALSAMRAAVVLTGATPAGAASAVESRPAAVEAASSGTPFASEIGAAAREGSDVAGEPQPREPAPVAQDLPIAGYDGLSAAAIVKRLPGLSAAQLAMVRAYEQSHRNRKTILTRIAALQSAGAPATNP